MTKLFRQLVLSALLSFICITVNAAGTFYSKGSLAPNTPSNWNTATNGFGTDAIASDFTDGSTFIVQSSHSMVTTATWTLSGGCTLEIGNGGSIQANHNIDLSGDGFLLIDDGGTYIHNNATALVAGIFNADDVTINIDGGNGGSTVDIRNTSVSVIIPTGFSSGSGEYSNLSISASGTVSASESPIIVNDRLTINSGSTLNMGVRQLDAGAGSNFSTSGTGTLQTQSSLSSPIPAGKTYTFDVFYNRTNTQAVVGANYNNLNVNPAGNRTRNYSGTIRIAGTFTPTTGTNNISSNPLFEFNGTTSQTIPAIAAYYDLTISNTGATVSAGGNLVVNGQLTVASSAIFDLVANTLSGTLATISGTGTIRTQRTASAALPTGKTWTQIVNYNNATGGQTVVDGTYATLMNSNTSNTNTASGAIATTNLTLGSGSSLDMSTFALTGLGGTISGSSGIISTQNTSSTPIPSSKTWPGTVVYNSSSSQTIVLGTYNNLTASSGARTLDINGNINISGTFVPGSGTYTPGTTAVIFNGSGSQNVPAISPAYFGLTISNTGTKTLTGDVVVGGTLTLSTSSDFLAIASNTLTLQGSTSLTGTLIGSSSSNLTISGSGGGSPTITFSTSGANPFLNTLTLNRTGSGAGLTLGTNISITNLLSVTNGTLDITGRTVTLKSTSLTNTAQVGPVGGSITYGGSGNFTVERFIPSGNRAYRDIAPGVNTSSSSYIFDNWQEAGSAPAGYGTHVTGLAGAFPGGVDATTGLDITQSGAATLFTYVNGVFSSVANTKTTKPNVYQGYRILIRGDRNVNLYQTPTPSGMNVATALRTTGELVTGTVTYTNSDVTNSGLNSTYTLNTNNAENDFSMIGNPYVALLDWEKIVAANRNTNLSDTYTVFNGSINTTGAYASYDAATDISLPNATKINQYIQPGQGFFVQNTTAFPTNPQLEIRESDKEVTGTFSQAFRTTSTVNKLRINLFKQLPVLGMSDVDGCAVAFIPTDNNGVDGVDVGKFANGGENLAIFRGNKRISIERRNSAATTDTIPLRLWQLTNAGVYSLCVDTRNFTSANRAYIIDKYLNTEKITKLNDTTNLSFSISTADTTSFINRFFIVFRSSVVPLNNINVKASTKNNGVQVEWNTTNEIQLLNYEVEKSIDGTKFGTIGTVSAKNGLINNYDLFDAAPQKGNNYYRIKIVNQNGSIQYSKIVLLNLGEIKNDITIYPNPVKGNSFSLQLNNLSRGTYQLELFNSIGQSVLSQKLVHNGGTGTQVIDLKNSNLAVGSYSVSIILPDGRKISKPIFIAE